MLSAVTPETHPRRPLARNRVYRFKGYRRNGFRVNTVSFRGHPEDDGAAPGVSITWLRGKRRRFWICCNNAEEFWAMEIFSNACDEEHA